MTNKTKIFSKFRFFFEKIHKKENRFFFKKTPNNKNNHKSYIKWNKTRKINNTHSTRQLTNTLILKFLILYSILKIHVACRVRVFVSTDILMAIGGKEVF